MKSKRLFLYLSPGQLDVLRHVRLHFQPVNAQFDPFEQNAKTIARQSVRITDVEFEAELDRQYKALPPQMAGLVSLDYFKVEARKKRAKIESQMKAKRQGKPPKMPSSAPYEQLIRLRLFERGDNPLLWERYADRHRGLVLEFDMTHPCFRQGKQILKPVQYGQARPRADHPEQPFPALFHQPVEYAAEKSWLLVRPQDEAKAEHTTASGRRIALVPFAPQALISVILGAAVDAEVSDQVDRILQYDMRYKPGRTKRQVMLDPDQFKLHLKSTL